MIADTLLAITLSFTPAKDSAGHIDWIETRERVINAHSDEMNDADRTEEGRYLREKRINSQAWPTLYSYDGYYGTDWC